MAMRKKDLETIRGLLSRRRALQGATALAAATVAGCGDGEQVSNDGDASTGDAPPTTTTADTSSTVADSSSGSADDSTSEGGPAETSSSTSGGGEESSTGEPVDACAGDGGLTPQELLADIDTIVVVMMENRSFDHYFGSAAFLEGWAIEGLTGAESNADLSGADIVVFPLANLQPADPPHDWDACHLAWNDGDNDGFVVQHELVNPASHTEVMGYHVRAQIPTLYSLAESYTLCDHWFASVMGPTWPNRFYLHAATSNGQQSNLPESSITHIWGVLEAAGIDARNYYSDIPWAWGGFVSPFASYTDSLDEFFTAAAAGTLPAFVVVDPNFGLLPGGEGGNDDHPDHDITFGQLFLASIYEAMVQSPQWNRCMLVITYDEHCGFFDHVAPPQTVDAFAGFEQLGFRVPSVVIGPTVRRGCVNSTQFEHVSVISTLTTKFGLVPLNERVSATNDLSSCIDPELVGNPQPPAKLRPLVVSRSELFAERYRGSSQPELAAMIADGRIPLPPDRRHPRASRDAAEVLLAHAQRLGVATVLP